MAGRVILFGGRFDGSSTSLLADTWHWDGTDWIQASPAASPAARTRQAMAYHELRGRPLIFGGAGGFQGFENFDDTWEYMQPFPASFTPFGAGCVGSAGVPTLGAAGAATPWIGGTFSARLDSVGSHPFLNIPFVVVGFSRTIWGAQQLPLDLSPFGMTGCTLLAEPALSFTLVNQGGFAIWSVALPNDPRIAGSSLFVQGGTTSFGTNPLGIVLTNAGELAIGAR